MIVETYSEQEPVIEIDENEPSCDCPDDRGIVNTECPLHGEDARKGTVWGDDGAYWPVKL